MKRTLIALGTLASIAVLSDNAWAGEYGGGYRPSGGGFGAGAVLGGVVGILTGVLATKAQEQPRIQSPRRRSMTLPVKIGLHASPRNASN